MNENPQELGVEIASHFEWNCVPIIEAFIAALEDANFHSLCGLVDAVKDFNTSQLQAVTEFAETV